MTGFTEVLTALSGTWSLVKAAINERDEAKIQSAEAGMSTALLSVHTQAFTLLEKLYELEARKAELEKELVDVTARINEKARYVLAPISTVENAVAYKLRDRDQLVDRVDEAPHWLCQPCFDAGRKVALHVGQYSALCPVCKASIDIARRPPIRHFGPSAF